MRFEAESVQEGGKAVLRRKGDVVQILSVGRLVRDVPLHGSSIGAFTRALSLEDSFALRDLLFTLSDTVIYDPRPPPWRSWSKSTMVAKPVAAAMVTLRLARRV